MTNDNSTFEVRKLSKVCPHCLVDKAWDQFGIHKNRADRLQVWCKPCRYSINKSGKTTRERFGTRVDPNEPLDYARLERDRRRKALLDELNNQHTGIVDGEVYIASNPAWPGQFKIGRAVNSADRVNGFNTCTPYRDWQLRYYVPTPDKAALERMIHERLAYCRGLGEWFTIDLEEAIEALEASRLAQQQQQS